jgi:hypothetical protein
MEEQFAKNHALIMRREIDTDKKLILLAE